MWIILKTVCIETEKVHYIPQLNSPRQLTDRILRFIPDKISSIRFKFPSNHNQDLSSLSWVKCQLKFQSCFYICLFSLVSDGPVTVTVTVMVGYHHAFSTFGCPFLLSPYIVTRLDQRALTMGWDGRRRGQGRFAPRDTCQRAASCLILRR